MQNNPWHSANFCSPAGSGVFYKNKKPMVVALWSDQFPNRYQQVWVLAHIGHDTTVLTPFGPCLILNKTSSNISRGFIHDSDLERKPLSLIAQFYRQIMPIILLQVLICVVLSVLSMKYLLPKMEAKVNIQGLGHVLGLARELAASTRRGGTDGRNSQHRRKSGLQCLQLFKPGVQQSPLLYQPSARIWMRKYSHSEARGERRVREGAASLIITWLQKGKIPLKKQDVFTELRNRSLPISVGLN